MNYLMKFLKSKIMQPLDKNKRYSLANCSDEQLKEILQWLKKNDIGWIRFSPTVMERSLIWKDDDGTWITDISSPTDICATTLFDQPKDSVVEDKKTFLRIAEDIINGARKEDYGEVDDNFSKIAEGWKLILGVDNITNRQVSHCMIWLKICRDLNTPKDDNIIDICGYAGLIEKMKQ